MPDERRRRGRRYEAAVVLTIVVLSKMAGERTLVGIAEWARLRAPLLREVFGLHGRIEARLPMVGKGREAATLVNYLAGRDCHNTIITADALHTQRRVCRLIRRQGGDFLFIVKRNQPSLYADIGAFHPKPMRRLPARWKQSWTSRRDPMTPHDR